LIGRLHSLLSPSVSGKYLYAVSVIGDTVAHTMDNAGLKAEIAKSSSGRKGLASIAMALRKRTLT
jgi:hypothetical protein